tara:strand:+ start:327 stop:2198 length:1872 start_codon:yes stop_codon:yes gene_type:complete
MSFHDEYDNGMESRYSLPFHRQGIPTSPQTPIQITELAKSLNMGVRNVEVGTLKEEQFESIPIQHFDEMRRLAQLSESKITMHAPIVDPAGFTQQGWSEDNRKDVETYVGSVLDRAQRLDPNGNIPIALHTTGAMLPGTRYYMDDNGQKQTEAIHAIDRENGKGVELRIKEKYDIDREKPTIWTPEKQLSSLNSTTWSNEKLELASKQMKAYDLMEQRKKIEMEMRPYEIKAAQIVKGEIKKSDLTDEERIGIDNLNRRLGVNRNQLEEFNKDIILKLNSMHEDLQKYKPKEEEEEQIRQYEESLSNFRTKNSEIREKARALSKYFEEKPKNVKYFKEAETLDLQRAELYKDISNAVSLREEPEKFVTSEEFHTEKVGSTVANSAYSAYSKFGDNTPIIALENVYGDNVLSRADTLKGVIIDSRKKLTNKLVEEKGMSESEAKGVADKLIGATWDVGHINMLRKQRYEGSLSEEEFKKEIVKQAKEIAPYTKHVHISDNFGFTDAHLPPGMGTSPIKEQLEVIDKEAQDAVHVMEGGAYAGQFKENPLPYTLESMDSPLYSHEMGPNWGQVRDMYSSYMVGMGDILPERYFNEFGVSFAKLPKELGGQLFGGDKSRFSGTPNQ